MRHRAGAARIRPLVVPISAFLLVVFMAGCGEQAETVKEDVEAKAGAVKEDVEEKVEEVKELAGIFLKMVKLSTEKCEDIVQMSVREGEGYDTNEEG